MQARFPVFVLAKDCGEILRFESLDEMQRRLERIDIENGEYEAWDHHGLPLDLKVREPVWLDVKPRSSESEGQRLADALMQYGSAVNVEIKVDEITAAGFDRAYNHVASHIKKRKRWKGF